LIKHYFTSKRTLNQKQLQKNT